MERPDGITNSAQSDNAPLRKLGGAGSFPKDAPREGAPLAEISSQAHIRVVCLGDHDAILLNILNKGKEPDVLTLFSTPKPFEGHTGIIQRNAIISWTRLNPRPDIILFGDSPGTAAICAELGLRHEPELPSNESRVPLLGALFEGAQRSANFDLLAYVNCDIMLLNDFLEAVDRVSAAQPRFLMVGLRWDTPMPDPWDFSKPGWESALRTHVTQTGSQPAPPGNSDYFAFPRGLWKEFPPIAIGRGGVDPWLVYEARRLGAAVADASAVMAIHQNHALTSNFQHIRQWRKEVSFNQGVVGKEISKFCLWDATHILTPSGLARPRGMRYWIRRLDTLHLRYPRFAAPLKITQMAAEQVRTFREKKAQSRNPVLSLGKLVVSKLPADGICAVLGMGANSKEDGAPGGNGLRLAWALTRVGNPVVVYDPAESAMERAKSLLAGPVKFATSAKDCLSDADVIVLASKLDEFENLSSMPRGNHGRPCVVIDCCGAYRPQGITPDIEYIPLAGG